MSVVDLHGSAPDDSPLALLLIDMISDFEFEDGEQLFAQALPMAQRLAAFKRRAKQAGIPAVYVNDNFGRWQDDAGKLLAHCLQEGVRGAPIARLLAPEPDDYFVLKPKNSGFYATTLEILLAHLHARRLILTGVAGNICVLFTANDASMRDFRLYVPCDCVASNTPEENEHALRQMARLFEADTTPSTALDLGRLLHETAASPSRP